MKDQRIIELFQERSENAITEITQKYGKLCMTLSRNILKSERDAEECVNDTYLAVWNTIPPQDPKSLSAYICRIARNLSLKKYHMNIAQKRNSYYDVILDEIEDCLISDQSVEDEIIGKELTERINKFLSQMKELDRVIFIRRYWFCDSISDIAKSLGLSQNYVTVHLHRTRVKLGTYLKMEDENHA